MRNFRPDPLAPGTLEALVAAAQSAATSSNLQTWSVVAVENPERKAAASVLSGDQAFIRDAPLFLVFCADLSRLTRVAAAVGSPDAGLDYLEMFLVAVIDAALAAQNAAVAAEGMGLGICYVGGARNQPRAMAELLALPPRVFAVFGLAVGQIAEGDTSPVKPRLPQSAVLHREKYDIEQGSAVAGYDAAMRRFYDAQKRAVKGDWSQHSARRIATAAALGGRDDLRAVLVELGFALR